MFQTYSNTIILGIVSIILSLIVTYLVRELAHRFGYVAKPKADRWHKRPTAMMGGVAIFIVTILLSIIFVPQTKSSAVILVSSSILFLVGLIDDILHIKPYQKLFGQIIGVSIIIGSGLVFPFTDYTLVNIGITVFWLIGITNAVNLLDNMDGLAGGISAIAAFALVIGFQADGQTTEALLVAIFIGALVGFLVYNFNPASIFMGDCGSMFIGFFLASTVLLSQTGGRSRSVLSVLAVPALILFVPIFDTTFVTILRKIWGRAVSQGGRDHTSHRLVALGLSERTAVLMLYGLALAAGCLSLLVRELDIIQSLALIGFFTTVLTIIGVYLGKVKVYEEQDEEVALQNNASFGFLFDLTHKRRIFEILLDAILISLSYYVAYVLLFGKIENTQNWELFINSLPILIVAKLFAFLAVGVYRGLWRYTGIRDLFTFSKATFIGSFLSIVGILLFYRFQYYSRAVFVIDALILLTAVSISRLMFRAFKQLQPNSSNSDGRKVLIYGAGDGGELILRELRNNPDLNYYPIGFVDDDPTKKDKVIHGLKVFGGNGSLAKIINENEVEEVLLSSQKISKERLEEIRELCNDADVLLKRASLKIEPIDDFFN
jgi:UDP-GlcNAc:undecaprenyl-phosphate GlcNAc-1-phosphate transferase